MVADQRVKCCWQEEKENRLVLLAGDCATALPQPKAAARRKAIPKEMCVWLLASRVRKKTTTAKSGVAAGTTLDGISRAAAAAAQQKSGVPICNAMTCRIAERTVHIMEPNVKKLGRVQKIDLHDRYLPEQLSQPVTQICDALHSVRTSCFSTCRTQ